MTDFTDDEREAAERLLRDINPKLRPAASSPIANDIRIVANAILDRHSAFTDPTDEQVQAAIVAWRDLWVMDSNDAMRAALRAAWGAR